jgi:hypothetical protein
MKRWWKTPGYPLPARVTRRRVGRAVIRFVVAGTMSLPIARPASDALLVNVPRTSGAMIEAWAFGAVSAATQPDSQEACDLAHVCALVVSSAGGAGTGTGTTIKTSFETTSQGQPLPNLPFTLTEEIDYTQPASRSVRGESRGPTCYPATGEMAITVDQNSTLVLDIVGQACQVGSSTARMVFTGSFAADSASTGTVVNADGIGSLSINHPSGLSGAGTPSADTTWIKAALVGHLLYGN